MAYGDIHNHNGSICKADKRPCPFGDEGHSKDVDSYVERKVEEHGIDGAEVKAMIADGTPLNDAVQVAREGLRAVSDSSSLASLTNAEFEDKVNEDTYGFIRKLQGEEKKKAIHDTAEILAKEYAEGAYEFSLELKNDPEEYAAGMKAHADRYRGSLAAIYDVPKSQVRENAYGDIQVDSERGPILYEKNFQLKKSSKADREGKWNGLPDESTNAERELKEKKLEVAYSTARKDLESLEDTKLKRAKFADLKKAAREQLAYLHGTSARQVAVDPKTGNFEVAGKNRVVSAYDSNLKPLYWYQSS